MKSSKEINITVDDLKNKLYDLIDSSVDTETSSYYKSIIEETIQLHIQNTIQRYYDIFRKELKNGTESSFSKFLAVTQAYLSEEKIFYTAIEKENEKIKDFESLYLQHLYNKLCNLLKNSPSLPKETKQNIEIVENLATSIFVEIKDTLSISNKIDKHIQLITDFINIQNIGTNTSRVIFEDKATQKNIISSPQLINYFTKALSKVKYLYYCNEKRERPITTNLELAEAIANLLQSFNIEEDSTDLSNLRLEEKEALVKLLQSHNIEIENINLSNKELEDTIARIFQDFNINITYTSTVKIDPFDLSKLKLVTPQLADLKVLEPPYPNPKFVITDLKESLKELETLKKKYSHVLIKQIATVLIDQNIMTFISAKGNKYNLFNNENQPIGLRRTDAELIFDILDVLEIQLTKTKGEHKDLSVFTYYDKMDIVKERLETVSTLNVDDLKITEHILRDYTYFL